jgi:hypothetical protein
MNFEVIETENRDKTTTKHIVVSLGDGAFTSFPAVEGNPAFDAFIAANPDALKKPAKAVKPADPAA